METNNNVNISSESGEKTTFWHTGWAYLVFLVVIIGFLVGLSYLVQYLM